MTDTELILTALLRVLEGQRKLAELYDGLPESVDSVPQWVRGGAEAVPQIESIQCVLNMEGGRHEVADTVAEYEEVEVPDKRCKGGVRREQKWKGSRRVVVSRYDTLGELIRDRLEKK